MTLRELRIRHDLTQSELAILTDSTQQAISHMENGKMRMSSDFAAKLISLFSLTLEQAWSIMNTVPDSKRSSSRRGPYVTSRRKEKIAQ